MKINSLQLALKEQLESFLVEQNKKYPLLDVLKIDLHCHDYNSDEPDELIGRILNIPETWISSEKLIQELKKNNCNVYTITNHNNARSCYEMQAKGYDVITAAEFSCWVPDYNIGIHVLAYGFTPEQEKRLQKLRRDIYLFQEFTFANNIPTIWAHPLYHYSTKEMPHIEFFNKMLLLFERFEMLNGQRDTWQNMLVKEWIENVTPEKIDSYSKKFGISPEKYCQNPYKKTLTGGSDSHMGIFSGLCGSYLYVPNLQQRIKTERVSELALEAIRKGDIVPYGSYNNSEKLTISFLDYACQIAINYKDTGLIRLLLHKGETSDKIISMIASNVFLEIQQHRVTMSFMELFHNCLLGKTPSFLKKVTVPKSYKPVFDAAKDMAKEHKEGNGDLSEKDYKLLLDINNHMNQLLFSRLKDKIAKLDYNSTENIDIEKLINNLELPTSLRSYAENKKITGKGNFDLNTFLDGLSFPFLASTTILAAHFISAKVLFNTRPFLKEFSNNLGKFKHPERVLWLTDTFEDKNGVSVVLQMMHKEIKKLKLPIDFLVCSETLQSDDNLIVVKPACEIVTPLYPSQPIRIPNFLQLHNLFHEKEYDRIICSTEGIMGAMGLYLKHAYSVPAYFYIHTDWVMFSRKVLNFDKHNQNRIRRFLRTYYRAFDKVFVLNSDQKKWLTGQDMNLDKNKVRLTTHWADSIFKPHQKTKKEVFGIDENRPVLLYVGRVSKEKGVLELPVIYKTVKKNHPEVILVVVGQGPAYNELKTTLPEAICYDWVEREKLPEIYSAADMLVFPSKFDTFSCVVLESLSCGLPVIAYSSKGPKDIIEDGICGYLVNTNEQMSDKINTYLKGDKKLHNSFKQAAIERSKNYDVNIIIKNFIADIDLK